MICILIQGLKSKAEPIQSVKPWKRSIELTGYVKELEAEKTEEAQARIENIDELISKTESFQEAMEEAGQRQHFLHFWKRSHVVGRYRFC